jgi:hypothetical protein
MNEYNVLENLGKASLLNITSGSNNSWSVTGSSVDITKYEGKLGVIVAKPLLKGDNWISASFDKSSDGSVWTNVATFAYTTASAAGSGSAINTYLYDTANLSTWARGRARGSGSVALSMYLIGPTK